VVLIREICNAIID
jgi:dynein heavy chain, axonemal